MSTTTRTSSPLESKPNLRTLLADLGVKHWSDGLKVKELQPTVYLKRVNDFNGEKFNILLYVLHILYWYMSVTFA